MSKLTFDKLLTFKMNQILETLVSLVTKVFTFYESQGDYAYEFFVNYSRTILDYLHVIFNGMFYILLYITIFLTFSYVVMAIYLLFKKYDKKEIPVKDKDLPFVTIQIPTFNEIIALNCARSCLEFDYPKNKFEIIIGDDSNDKSVSKKLDEFASIHNIVKITRRGRNIGFKPGNLNHMLKFSKGDYIVIFDSDFLPKKDFLRRIIAPFIHDNKVSAVQARWVTKNFSQSLASVVGGTIPLFTHYIGLPILNRINSNKFIAGSAEAIKKKDLIHLGGWRSGALTEDIEYSLQLTNAGKKIVYLENLHCECEAPFTIKDLCKQQMRWAFGVISALKIHSKKILLNKNIPTVQKFNMFLLMSGYLITLFFFFLTLTGTLSVITHRPEIIDWGKFISETVLNIILTSGFLMVCTITLILSKKAKEIPRMIMASLSVGLVVIFVVTLGIFKAIFNRDMHWFMLNKRGI